MNTLSVTQLLHRSHLRRTALLLCLATLPYTLNAAVKVQETATQLALEFLKGDKTSEDDLKAFEKEKKFDGYAPLKKAFESTVTFSRGLIKEGLDLSSPAFDLLLAENFGGSTKTTTEKETPKPAAKAEAPEDKDKELLAGAAYLQKKSRYAIYFAAHVHDYLNLIPEPQTAAGEDGRIRDITPDLWKKGIDYLRATPINAETKPADLRTALQKATPSGEASPDSEHLVELLESTGKKSLALTAQDAKTGTSTDTGTGDATTKTTDKQQKPTVVDEKGRLVDATLKNWGFSVTTGMGTVHGFKESPGMAVVQVRWNFIQERSTLRWNDYVSRAHKDKDRVTYHGLSGMPLLEDYMRRKDPFEQGRADSAVYRLYHYKDWEPSFVGLFFGSAIAGNKIRFGHNSSGEEITERPLLAGISVGWGFYNEASSLIHLDFGCTISPTNAFSHSRPYIGISGDGRLLLDLFAAIRDFTP